MDYRAHYDRLIGRASARQLTGYSERHHIVPRCLGGDNTLSNIVRLTPEEHYVAHQLLVKMHPSDHRLLWAASNMTGASAKQPHRRNKLYGWLRRRLADEARKRHTGRKMSPEARAKMSASRLGSKRGPHTVKTRTKMSAAAKGKAKSPEHRAALSAAKLGKKRGPQSAEHRRKLSESIGAAMKSRDQSVYRTPEYRAKQAAQMRDIWARRKAS